MAQLNLIERSKEAVIQLNGNKRQVIDIWFNGIKVWPINEPDNDFYVDKNTITLNKHNNFSDILKVYCPAIYNWVFGV